MASLLIKAENLSVGDVLLLPFNKTATITALKPFGPRSVYVRYRTEYGWSRVERDHEVHVQSRVA